MTDTTTEELSPDYREGYAAGFEQFRVREQALRQAIVATQNMANPTSERVCRWAAKFEKFLRGEYVPGTE